MSPTRAPQPAVPPAAWRLPRRALLGLALVLAALPGCNIIAAAVNLARPPEIAKAEFTFPEKSTIALLLDPVEPGNDQPVFNDSLHQRLVQYFRDNNSTSTLLPLESVYALRRGNPDFDSWSVQRVGRELDADYVLQLRIRRLGLRESENYTVPAAQVDLAVKVIAVDHPAADARVWPDSPDGRPLRHERRPGPHSGHTDMDSELNKLARETAYYVMKPFFDVNVEEPPPVEK